MNHLQNWNPFKELETFQNRLSRMMTSDWDSLPVNKEASYIPSVDIIEDKEAFHFKMDLPEVKKEDIKVECHDGLLTISGTKKMEKDFKKDDAKYHRIERSYGSFMRSFTLPETANADMVNAEFVNGVLDLKIAKKQISAPKTKLITIK